ncbi:MAG: ABC transporter substrate-binding protein [Bacteroidaceae bacterium]|nr:ABC transporter substrate-binding protein [Bacteroidaceae bacterium]
MRTRTILILAQAALLMACSQGAHFNAMGGIMEYSDHIVVEDTPQGFNAQIANPWKKNTLLHSYTFSTGESTAYSYTKGSNTIHIPLQRIVVMTNSLAHLMVELGAEECIAGVCEPEYISDSLVRARLANGTIADCGNSMYPTIEKIMELHPDAIMVSPFEETGYGQLEKLGIPLLECADYMETSPLARAEWMRFYGRLFGAGECADSLFKEVEKRYFALKKTASKTHLRPKVMLDTRKGSAWYVAGGQSTIGQMIADANALYAFAEDKSSGSVPLSFETVFEKASDSDFWLLKNSSSNRMTYKMLEQDYKPYSSFRPFRERNIWICDVYQVPYFELTAFHPEMLLGEFISIFHPEISSVRYFYHPLDE